MTNRLWTGLLPATLAVLLTGPALAQNCSPGPRCQALSNKAQAYMADAQSRMRGNFIAAGAAGTNYCVMKMMAEVNRACGEELRSMRQPQCASLALAQSEEFTRNAEQSKAASQAMASTTTPWTEGCGW